VRSSSGTDYDFAGEADVAACSLFAFCVAALRRFDFAARLWALFNFRFLCAFFSADLLLLGMVFFSGCDF
jgi:hypothetical protein